MQQWIDTNVLVVENESGMLFTYGHLLGLRTGTICVALGSMFADAGQEAPSVYGAYSDPDFLARPHRRGVQDRHSRGRAAEGGIVMSFGSVKLTHNDGTMHHLGIDERPLRRRSSSRPTRWRCRSMRRS